MPGPVSDSYDPEFSTRANRHDVAAAMKIVVRQISMELGPELKHIVGVVHGPKGDLRPLRFHESELRLIRFGLNRALEDF